MVRFYIILCLYNIFFKKLSPIISLYLIGSYFEDYEKIRHSYDQLWVGTFIILHRVKDGVND